jgi:hypothetical protein
MPIIQSNAPLPKPMRASKVDLLNNAKKLCWFPKHLGKSPRYVEMVHKIDRLLTEV